MLPQELIDAIAGYLPEGHERAHCAALSRSWQRAIEKLTFYSLKISIYDNLEEELHKFEQYLIPWRFRCVRELCIKVDVLNLNVSSTQSLLSEPLTQKLLIERLRKPFEIMAAKNSALSGEMGTGYARGSFSLNLEALMDCRMNPSESEHNTPDLPDTVDYESLPILDFVTRLEICDMSTILPLGVGLKLSSRMPKVHDIELETSQRPEFWFSEWVHIHDRRHLASTITDTQIIDKFRGGQFTLNVWARDDFNMRPSLLIEFPNSHVNKNAPSYDPMGRAIRTFSQNLTSLSLTAVLDASIFWPQPNEADVNKEPIPHWPNLRHLTVRMGVARSDGTYYFERPHPPSIGDPDVVPREDSMQELFSSWAKALSRMPRLDSATLWFRIHRRVYLNPPDLTLQSTPHDPIRWMVGFHAPGVVPDPRVHSCQITEEGLQRPRLTFERTHGWRPERTTMEALRRMARDRFYGKELAEIESDTIDYSKVRTTWRSFI